MRKPRNPFESGESIMFEILRKRLGNHCDWLAQKIINAWYEKGWRLINVRETTVRDYYTIRKHAIDTSPVDQDSVS